MPKKPNREPKIRKDRKELHNSNNKVALYDSYKINQQVYEFIKLFLSGKKFKTKKQEEYHVNKLIPGHPNLWVYYNGFHRTYEQLKEAEKKQKLLDLINDNLNNMEEHKNFALSLTKKKKKKIEGDEKGNPYQKEFDFLDEQIERIEIWIYLGASPSRICMELGRECKFLNPIIFHRWSDETKHGERLIYAAKKSGENYIHLGKDFILEWLDPTKHPELDMQHAGLIREVSLYYSRMAEFMDRKRWGRKVEIIDDRPQQKVLSGKDINDFLASLGKVAEPESESEKESEESDESEFTEFEEI